MTMQLSIIAIIASQRLYALRVSLKRNMTLVI